MVDHVKSLGKLIAIVNFRSGEQGRLKPWAILCAGGRRADAVEWLERKPCWLSERRSELSSGCRRRSRTLTAVQNTEMG